MTPRALIVEDDGAYAFMLHRHLEHYLLGWDFIVAPTMHEALAVCQRSVVRLIILDLNLPDSTQKNSIESIIALRGDAPVVVLTGAHVRDTPSFMECFSAGAEEVWEKNALTSREGILFFTHSIHAAIARNEARISNVQRT